MDYYVYVLRSEKNGSSYTGITNDVNKRVEQHNKGYTFSTKNKVPLKLIHQEKFDSRIKARTREKYLKSGIGREFIRKLI